MGLSSIMTHSGLFNFSTNKLLYKCPINANNAASYPWLVNLSRAAQSRFEAAESNSNCNHAEEPLIFWWQLPTRKYRTCLIVNAP